MALRTCQYGLVMTEHANLHMRLSRACVHDDNDVVFHALCNHLSLIASQLKCLTGSSRNDSTIVVILHWRIHSYSRKKRDASKECVEVVTFGVGT